MIFVVAFVVAILLTEPWTWIRKKSIADLEKEIRIRGWPKQVIHNFVCPVCGEREEDECAEGPSYNRGDSDGGSAYYTVKCKCGNHFIQDASW